MFERTGVTSRASDRVEPSGLRFSDGTQHRIEIPSTEGPRVFEAVLTEATERGVSVRRVSQGSGVMMLTDEEIRDMAHIGSGEGIEVSLFVGPRAAWGTGRQAAVAGAVGGTARGLADVWACLREADRACHLGIRSLLVGDIGVLKALADARAAGDLPKNLVLKTSVVLPTTNPLVAQVLAELGADTINLATDLPVADMAEIREAIAQPLDMYVEAPADQGGSIRFYDVGDFVRYLSPIYLKFGIRNSQHIYPSGKHLEGLASDLGRERVRRAHLCLRLLTDLHPDLANEGDENKNLISDLAVPEP